MDEYTAWQNFVETGRVSDYLAYCRVKLGYPPENTEQKPGDSDERGNSGTDIKRTDSW